MKMRVKDYTFAIDEVFPDDPVTTIVNKKQVSEHFKALAKADRDKVK